MYAKVWLKCKFCEKEFEYLPQKTLGGSKGTSLELEKISPLVSCPFCKKKAIYLVSLKHE
jgi:hypothetical protein